MKTRNAILFLLFAGLNYLEGFASTGGLEMNVLSNIGSVNVTVNEDTSSFTKADELVIKEIPTPNSPIPIERLSIINSTQYAIKAEKMAQLEEKEAVAMTQNVQETETKEENVQETEKEEENAQETVTKEENKQETEKEEENKQEMVRKDQVSTQSQAIQEQARSHPQANPQEQELKSLILPQNQSPKQANNQTRSSTKPTIFPQPSPFSECQIWRTNPPQQNVARSTSQNVVRSGGPNTRSTLQQRNTRSTRFTSNKARATTSKANIKPPTINNNINARLTNLKIGTQSTISTPNSENTLGNEQTSTQARQAAPPVRQTITKKEKERNLISQKRHHQNQNEYESDEIAEVSTGKGELDGIRLGFCDTAALGAIANIRLIGLKYPRQANSLESKRSSNYINSIIEGFPCEKEKNIMKDVMKTYPPVYSDRKSFNKWAILFGKRVLKKLKITVGLSMSNLLIPNNKKKIEDL